MGEVVGSELGVCVYVDDPMTTTLGQVSDAMSDIVVDG